MSNPEGPFKVWLKRFNDSDARVWVQRWKRDHPVTISLTLDEFRLLCDARGFVEQQVAALPRTETTAGSVLDLGSMVRLDRGQAAE